MRVMRAGLPMQSTKTTAAEVLLASVCNDDEDRRTESSSLIVPQVAAKVIRAYMGSVKEALAL